MRAVAIDSQGTFRLEQRPEPAAGPGAVVVRVRAAGLNAADLQQARGYYPAPPGWPADVPGLEVAGEVGQVGPGVTGVAPGDRVMALVGGADCLQRVALLRSQGKVLLVGVQAGTMASLRMFDLMLARAQLIGTTIRGRSHAEKTLLAAAVRTSVVPLLAQGRLRVPVDAAFPLARFADAYARLAGPGKFGKVRAGPTWSGPSRCAPVTGSPPAA